MRFIGREKELSELFSVFVHAAERGSTMLIPHQIGAQLLTIVAETGVGKSRLVQEFYNRLTTNPTWDPEICNYWPDAFQTPQSHMHVNPIMDGHIAQGPPKFLWIGVRWMNPTERNGVLGGALHTIRDQLLVHAQFIQKNKTIWQLRLEKLRESAIDKANIQTLISLVADNLIPFSGLAIDILSPAINVSTPTTQTAAEAQHQRDTDLSEDLLRLFLETQNGDRQIPIVLWLDDAQWMDDVSTRFLFALTRMIKQYRLPVAIIATFWPQEWNTLEDSHFLKSGETLILNYPTNTDLRALLVEKFPGLSDESIALILDKSHANYLSLHENMGQLLTETMYFIDENIGSDLSPQGAKMVSGWEGSRLRRIKQRFTSLSSDTKKTLGRASVIGNAFFGGVVERFSQSQGIADPALLLQQCIMPLTIVAEQSREFLEFRDRGYFNVANTYFANWLATDEQQALDAVLAAEVSRWVDAAYTVDGDFVEPPDNPLMQLPISDQLLILGFAHSYRYSRPQVWFRATVLACEVYAHARLWEAVKSTTLAFDRYDWAGHEYTLVNLHPLEHLTMLAEVCSNLEVAETLCRALLAEKIRRSTTTPSPAADREVTIGYNMLGNVLRTKGDDDGALAAYTADIALSRALLADDPSPANRRELSVVLNKVGNIAVDRDDIHVARAAYTESDQLLQSVLTAENTVEHRFDWTYNQINWALWHYRNGEAAKGQATLEDCIAHRIALCSERPTAEHYAATAFAIEKKQYFVDDPAQHERILVEVLAYAERALAVRGNLDDLARVAETCETIANRLFDRHAYDDALRYADIAHTHANTIAHIRSTSLDEYRLFSIQTLLGYLMLTTNRISDGASYFAQAINAFDRITADDCSYEDYANAVDTGLAYAMAQAEIRGTHAAEDFRLAETAMIKAIDACQTHEEKEAARALLMQFIKEALRTDSNALVLTFVGQQMMRLE